MSYLLTHDASVSTLIFERLLLVALNVGPDFCTVLGTAALLSKGALEKGGVVFDLDDLNQHNFPTEHDG